MREELRIAASATAVAICLSWRWGLWSCGWRWRRRLKVTPELYHWMSWEWRDVFKDFSCTHHWLCLFRNILLSSLGITLLACKVHRVAAWKNCYLSLCVFLRRPADSQKCQKGVWQLRVPVWQGGCFILMLNCPSCQCSALPLHHYCTSFRSSSASICPPLDFFSLWLKAAHSSAVAACLADLLAAQEGFA